MVILCLLFLVMLDCDENICENNGTCRRHVLTYTCDCPDGFIGAFCQDRGMLNKKTL